MQLSLRRLRDLTLVRPSALDRPLHLSAASGLVATASALFIVADDENHLGIFPRSSIEPGNLLRLFEGQLSDAKPKRKRQKPDLECLMALPPFGRFPHGAMLALGSGSTPARRRGVMLALDSAGAISKPPQVIDLGNLLQPLDALFPDLNLEGGTVRGNELLLFQRGHAGRPENFAIRFDLPSVLSGLAQRQLPSLSPLGVVRLELGHIGHVPFSVTDAASLPDGRTLVTAVAEDTSSTYADGTCVGALVALLDNELSIVKTWPLAHPHKIEGVSARLDGDHIDLLLVTDADDPDTAATLFAAELRGDPAAVR